MKIRKERTDKRATYTYNYSYVDENGKKISDTVTLTPGEDGVTESHIKMLHAMDDCEVNNNLKNARPKRTEEDKEEIRQWTEEYIRRETEIRGYAPDRNEVMCAVEERFPRNYNLSLDYVISDEDSEKSHVQSMVSTSFDNNPRVERLYEVISELTDKQRDVLIKVGIEGYSLTDVAAMNGTSVPNVKKHYDKAVAYIRNNF